MTETDNNRKLKVFLCHASEDKLAVRELYQRLKRDKWIDPWLDEENLLPGQDWDLEIEKAVEDTDAVLVFLSHNVVNKAGYIQKEIKKVLDVSDEKPDGTIFVIPVRLEDIEPPKRLAKRHYVDYFQKEHHEKSYQRVLRSLALLSGQLNISLLGGANKLRILIVDDHKIVVDGLKMFLGRISRFEIVGVAHSGREAVRRTFSLKPDVVLMNIRLPDVSGIDACEEIVNRFPETKVLMLTSYADDEMLLSAIRAGASGYVLKQIDSDDLVKALDSVGSGESLLDPAVAEHIFNEVRSEIHEEETSPFSELSQQEKHVLGLISMGNTNREIARILFLGEGTVRNNVSNILSKLGVNNRAEAAAYAVEHQLRNYLDR